MKVRKYRCTNGHEWEASMSETISFSVAPDPSLDIKNACMRCLLDLLHGKLGAVYENGEVK